MLPNGMRRPALSGPPAAGPRSLSWVTLAAFEQRPAGASNFGDIPFRCPPSPLHASIEVKSEAFSRERKPFTSHFPDCQRSLGIVYDRKPRPEGPKASGRDPPSANLLRTGSRSCRHNMRGASTAVCRANKVNTVIIIIV